MSTGLIAIALLASAPGPAGLQKGDQFAFAGTAVEHVDRPAQRLHREYKLALRVFVLDREENWADAAVMTVLRRSEDAVGGISKTVSGTLPDKNAPPIVRLDIVRIHTDGSVHLLLPVGSAFRLGVDTPAQAVPPIPLDAFNPSELGVFPPRIPRSTAPGETWTVASGFNRPDEVWMAKKFEFINAEQCQMLVVNQQSADWAQPVGGQTSWQRADAVWVSTQDGTARKVHRVIRQRDGRANEMAAWVEVKYELAEHEKLTGRNYDRTRRDVEVAYLTLAEAATQVRDAARLGPRFFESKLIKLDAHLEQTEPGTPYREAILSARRTLEAARRGEAAPPPPPPPTTTIAAMRGQWPEPGQIAPNFTAGKFQLAERGNKPAALVFFKPGCETTDLALAIADALQKRWGAELLVIPLTIGGDAAAANADCKRLKLTLDVRDGTAAAAAYGVETFPRFALIDSAGKVKWTFVGVGSETGFLIQEQVDRLARPTLPNGPPGITTSPGSTTLPSAVRP